MFARGLRCRCGFASEEEREKESRGEKNRFLDALAELRICITYTQLGLLIDLLSCAPRLTLIHATVSWWNGSMQGLVGWRCGAGRGMRCI